MKSIMRKFKRLTDCLEKHRHVHTQVFRYDSSISRVLEKQWGKLAYILVYFLQTAMDQLHMHFTSAIHNTTFTIVLGYVELCAGTGDSNFQKKQYIDLCKVCDKIKHVNTMDSILK